MNTYALILNCRDPEKVLDTFVKSVEKRTTKSARVKTVIILDDDDQSSLGYMRRYQRKLIKSNILWRVQARTYNLNRNLNIACGEIGADFYWGLNVDTEIITDDWDILLDHKITPYKDKAWAFYIDDDDLREDKPFCCFPIITRKLYQVLNCFMPVELPTEQADVWFDRIVKGGSEQRVIMLPEIKVRHFKYTDPNYVANPDRVQVTVKTWLEKWEMANYLHRMNTAIEMGL